MKWKALSWIILAIAMAQPCLAEEFYRYVDQHGNVLFTDDLSKVPPEQRDKVTAYEQSESRPDTGPTEKNGDNSAAPAAVKEKRDQERSRLEAMGQELDKEYQNLTEERDRLAKEKDQSVTNAQIKEYNKKIGAFNERIKAYEEKRTAYTDAVKEFNAKLKESK
jgi:chromosome segregation ATPase